MLSWSPELDRSSSASKEDEYDRRERFVLFDNKRCGGDGQG
jgi:hypothetical protein